MEDFKMGVVAAIIAAGFIVIVLVTLIEQSHDINKLNSQLHSLQNQLVKQHRAGMQSVQEIPLFDNRRYTV
jgi:Flp pilus assembly protein TadB